MKIKIIVNFYVSVLKNIYWGRGKFSYIIFEKWFKIIFGIFLKFKLF